MPPQSTEAALRPLVRSFAPFNRQPCKLKGERRADGDHRHWLQLGQRIARFELSNKTSQQFYKQMATREKLYSPHFSPHTLSGLIRAKTHKPDSEVNPSRRDARTLPQFQKVHSESRLSRATSAQDIDKHFERNTRNVYGKLFNELKEIKETLKESLVHVSRPKRKKSVKRKEKVVTEISDAAGMLKHSHSYNRHSNNYYDVLKHIDEIKSRNRLIETRNKAAEGRSKVADTQKMQGKGEGRGEQEKTLFYGVDYIDNIEFKIKIKLSRTTYLLFAKNNHAKIMVEMSYSEYMRLNLAELKGNPCNILQFLKIENNKVKFKLKFGPDKSKFYTFKSFLSYY